MPNFAHILAFAIIACGCACAWRSRGRTQRGGEASGACADESAKELMPEDWLSCMEAMESCSAICVDDSLKVVAIGRSASSALRVPLGAHVIDAVPEDAAPPLLEIVLASRRDVAVQRDIPWGGASAHAKAAMMGNGWTVAVIRHDRYR